jgi:hypothetical protein
MLHSLRDWLDEFFARWPWTMCLSDERNTVHHRWLEWMGYEHAETVNHGPYQFPFRLYEKEID